MKRILLLLAYALLLTGSGYAQFSRFLVQLRDKAATPYTLEHPENYLSARAIDRRHRYGIPVDSLDLPVCPDYLARLAAVPGVTILNASRWLNQVSVQCADSAAVSGIHALPFVRSVAPIAARQAPGGRVTPDKFDTEGPSRITGTGTRDLGVPGNYYNYGSQAFGEIHLHHGEFLHNLGLRGQTIQIALLDGGYYHYNNLGGFDSVLAGGQVLDTWDFVAREASVAEDNSHGMSCFSTLAANLPGQLVGTAPAARYYLFRTEDVSSEYPIEEHNWVCGAERADSSGADVLSASLGYNTFDDTSFNHHYRDLDGKTTLAARGAAIAARKGLLVFVAAGNSGGDAWHYILTPADADSILAVGAVDTGGRAGSFSSYGPSADGRIKPDVASVGVNAQILTTANTVAGGTGTSYACPKLAGLGACLWQAFPEKANTEVLQAIRRAGSQAASPDNRIGYGIPDMKKAFALLLGSEVRDTASLQGCSVALSWTSKDAPAMLYQVRVKRPGDSAYSLLATQAPLPAPGLATHHYQLALSVGSQPGSYSLELLQVLDTSAAGYTALAFPAVTLELPPGCPSSIGSSAGILALYPNPGSGQVTLVLNTPQAYGSLRIRVVDWTGRLMQQYRVSKGTGPASYPLQPGGLAAGIYLISVDDGHRRIGTVKLLRQ